MGLFAKAATLRDPGVKAAGPREREPKDLHAPDTNVGNAPPPRAAQKPAHREGLLRRSQVLLQSAAPAPPPPEPEPEPELAVEREPVSEPEPESLPEPELLQKREPAPEPPPEPTPEPEPVPEEAAAPARPQPEPQPAAPPPPLRLDTLKADIEALHVGIEAPGAVFALLRTRLGLEKAAILVPDAARSYAPWAACGFDRTTLRRLRLSPEDCSAVASLEGDALKEVLRLFSTRDAAGVERLRIWPCPGEPSAAAVVVVAETDAAAPEDARLADLLPEILEAAGRLLTERREAPLIPARAAAARQAASSPAELVDEALRRHGGAAAKAALVKVSLAALTQAVAAQEPGLDRFRLADDLAAVLGRVLADTAEVAIAPSPDALLLFVFGTKNRDTELILHAILGPLQSACPTAGALDLSSLEPRTLLIPENGAGAAELIAALA